MKRKADSGGRSEVLECVGGEVRVRGSVRQIKGCDSQGNLVTVLKTIVITGLIRSQVSVHTSSSFWKSKCIGLNGVFVRLQNDSVVVPSSQPLLARTSTDMNM